MFDRKQWNALGRILLDHAWIIGVNKTSTPLYTSDNPVVKWGHFKSPILSYDGFASPGIEIAFPLTPNFILLIFDRGVFPEMAARLDNKVSQLNEENVTYYNSLQVLQSFRQVYCSTRNFDLAEEMCADDPQISDLTKRRVEVYLGGLM
jgi:hypothetical protein